MAEHSAAHARRLSRGAGVSYHRNPYDRPIKKLELAIRRVFNRTFLVDRIPATIYSVTDALNMGPQVKILFLRQDRIGDVLITAPIVKAVRERYPEATIDVVLSRNNSSVAATLAPYINEIHTYQKTVGSLYKVVRAIRRRRYDVVVDMLDNTSSTSSILVSGAKARYAVGIDKENRGVYTHVVPLLSKKTTHISDRVSQLLLAFGIEPSSVDMRPVYPVSKHDAHLAKSHVFGSEPPSNPVGVVFSGSSVLRTFPADKLIDVLRQVSERYPAVSFYIFGAPHHQAEVKRIAQHAGAHAVPTTGSFHAYACALHEMKALISPDTSAVHLAAAWNMPTCVLFNQPDPDQHPWYPYHTYCEAVINPGEDLNDIEVGEFVSAIERLFAYCSFPKG